MDMEAQSFFWKVRNTAIMLPGGMNNDRRGAWELAVTIWGG